MHNSVVSGACMSACVIHIALKCVQVLHIHTIIEHNSHFCVNYNIINVRWLLSISVLLGIKYTSWFITAYKVWWLAAWCCIVLFSFQVAVITKTEEEDISTQYTLNFTGQIVSQKPSHLGQGKTQIIQSVFSEQPKSKTALYNNSRVGHWSWSHSGFETFWIYYSTNPISLQYGFLIQKWFWMEYIGLLISVSTLFYSAVRSGTLSHDNRVK